VAEPGPEVDEALLTEERHRLLLRHFARLPERRRMLLRVLAQTDRPVYTAVAEALGMPRGSIGPPGGRCLAKLRELMLADAAWSLT
jgi:DNA-directed RNA polymerase specialized sigma24 family protein